MRTVTIGDVRRRWPAIERALARDRTILITRRSRAVAKLVRIAAKASGKRPHFDPVKHLAWQRRVSEGITARWSASLLKAQRCNREVERRRRGP